MYSFSKQNFIYLTLRNIKEIFSPGSTPPEYKLENNNYKKDLKKFFANDFTLELSSTSYPYLTKKTASLFVENNNIEVTEQADIYKLWDYYKIDKFIKDAVPATQENRGYYGGVRKIFKFKSNTFALLSLKDKSKFKLNECFFASIINLTSRTEVFRAPCIPEAKNVDFNAIGGGNVELNGSLLFALGSATVYGEKTASLAQDYLSPYGKILSFSEEDLLTPLNSKKNKFSFTVYSSGHRNIQGLLVVRDQIYAVEHGPKGGDEINIIKKNKNYGWPLFSLGSTYEGKPYKALGDSKIYEPPLYSFIPSPALSDITNCPQKLQKRYQPLTCLMISSLKGQSIFIALIESNIERVISIEQINVGMRIREFSKGDSDKIYISTDLHGIFEIEINNIAGI